MRSSAATVWTVLRCSSAALSENRVAAAIARPARTRCRPGHRERKRISVARVSTVGGRGSMRADLKKNKYVYTYTSSFSSTAVKNILGYSTKNSKFKRLEPYFQISVTRSEWKVTETAVALPHSRECTKEPISALPNYGLKGKVRS